MSEFAEFVESNMEVYGARPRYSAQPNSSTSDESAKIKALINDSGLNYMAIRDATIVLSNSGSVGEDVIIGYLTASSDSAYISDHEEEIRLNSLKHLRFIKSHSDELCWLFLIKPIGDIELVEDSEQDEKYLYYRLKSAGQ